jgi:hypothetical protein
METQAWQVVAEPPTEAGAQILLGLLQSEGIPARLRSNVPVPGLGISFKVEVQADFLSRAEDVLHNPQINEEELAQLAASSPPADDA